MSADSLLILSALCAWAALVLSRWTVEDRDAMAAKAKSMERQRDEVLQANKRLSLAAEHWATRYCEMDAMAKEHAADADYWISAAIEAYKQLGSPLPEDRKDSVRDMRVIDSLIRSTGARPS